MKEFSFGIVVAVAVGFILSRVVTHLVAIVSPKAAGYIS